MTLEQALSFVDTVRSFRIVAIDLSLFDLASNVAHHTRYGWCDGLIVAAAISAGCDTLATEDMQHGRVIDGVHIADPFRELA